MVLDLKKIDLFGKQFLQKVVLETPFEFTFPEANQACLLYMTKGELQFLSNQATDTLSNKYALLLNCMNSGNKLQESSSKLNGEIVIITFHPDLLKKVYEKEIPALLHSSEIVSNQAHMSIKNDMLIGKYIESLLFYFENPSLVYEEILILKLKEIILLLSQTTQANTIQVIISQLFTQNNYAFKEIIESNMYSSYSIEELAQMTNMSVSTFKREFKKHYNDSPANYIRVKKLERAADYLITSNTRITDIAFDCGFNDLSNFTKSFHGIYGCSPSNYRLNYSKSTES